MSLLEAMAAGIFPVVSDIPANRAWLNGDGDAEFFPVGDAPQLADRLQRVITNPTARAAASESLRQRVVAKCDRTTNMRRLAEAYENLVAQHRKGR
jgi:glycosyltransferase involved in cell wall biosynthesis